MSANNIKRFLLLGCFAAALLPVTIAQAQNYRPLPEMKEGAGTSSAKDVMLEAGITPKLGVQLDLNLPFYDELGQKVTLGDFFKTGKPVVLQLGYYECPQLCGQVLQGMLTVFKSMEPSLEKDFHVVSVSINPKETPTLAAQKRLNFTRSYGRENAQAGWHFLTGSQTSIDALADSVGFAYRYDRDNGQYAHGSAIIVLTPQGKTAQYFSGIEYPTAEVTAALRDATQEKVASKLSEFIRMLCYHYDPTTNAYSLSVLKIVRFMGAGVLLMISGTIAFMLIYEKRRARAAVKIQPEVHV